MPYMGGLYVYIENLYGHNAGFLAGWAQIIAYGPAVIGLPIFYAVTRMDKKRLK